MREVIRVSEDVHRELKASEFFRETYYLYVVLDPLGPSPRLVVQRPPFKVKREVVVKQYVVEVDAAGG
jgi:hypothetical protein